MANERFTAEEVAKAIEQSKGILAVAARSLSCNRGTVDNYIKRYPTVKKAFDEANETTIDFVESKLLKNIDDGDTASIIFFLKTKGKNRGYVERQEISGKDGGAIEHDVKSSIVIYIPDNGRDVASV